jgi:hypothetical protein
MACVVGVPDLAEGPCDLRVVGMPDLAGEPCDLCVVGMPDFVGGPYGMRCWCARLCGRTV